MITTPGHLRRQAISRAETGPATGIRTLRSTAGDKPLAPMMWMQRLERVFSIEIETCPKCGGKLRTIACVEDLDVIATILEHI